MLNNKLSNVGVVILAAGKGTRLNCIDRPKVMLEIGGKPIVSYIVETLKNMGFSKDQIVLVVGFYKEKIMEYFGNSVTYAIQDQQLGTGHAAYVGMNHLLENIEYAVVMGGDDGSFYKPETIVGFIQSHLKNNCTISVLSTEVKDPASFGRIINNEKGVQIIEKEYLTDTQKQILEVNTGTYIFDIKWFQEMFPRMPKMNKLGEFGINPSITIAQEENRKTQVVKLQNSNEWFGINTPAELKEANKRKSNFKF